MDGVAFGVEDDENGVAETAGVAEVLHGFGVFVGLGVVDVDVYVVLLDDGRHDAAGVGKLSETHTPRAPVAAHLTEDVSVGLLREGDGLVDLLHGIAAFVVDLFLRLQPCGSQEEQAKKRQ